MSHCLHNSTKKKKIVPKKKVSEECHESITRLNALLSDVLWPLREQICVRLRERAKKEEVHGWKIQLVYKKKTFFFRASKCASNPNGRNWINGKATLCTETRECICTIFHTPTCLVVCYDGFFVLLSQMIFFFLVGVLSQNVSLFLCFCFFFSRDLWQEV